MKLTEKQQQCLRGYIAEKWSELISEQLYQEVLSIKVGKCSYCSEPADFSGFRIDAAQIYRAAIPIVEKGVKNLFKDFDIKLEDWEE